MPGSLFENLSGRGERGGFGASERSVHDVREHRSAEKRRSQPAITDLQTGSDGLTGSAIVDLLDMKRHPEGGWYVEVFRDAAGPDGRARSTVIYFLLEAGDVSAWHRVRDAVEVWHFHAGAPLELRISGDDGPSAHRLGIDLVAGERPQAIVPADAWQSARSLGDWTLVGCTVAPGFEFASFELAPAGWEPNA